MPELSFLRNRPEFWLAGVIALCVTALSFATPSFLSLSNFVDLTESYAVQAIMATGLFVVLIAGGIDISFAATASVAQYIAALLSTHYELSPALVILAGLTVGAGLGFVNAALIHYARVNSIIITIATMNIYFALLMYFTDGHSIYNLPNWWSERVTFLQFQTAGDDLTRITLPIMVMIVSLLTCWVLLNHSKIGRQLYAMGGNAEAARRFGLNISKLKFFAYGFAGFMAAVAGLVQANRVGEAVPNALYGTELSVLSAAVLGGASLLGGVGTVGGITLGILLLAIIQNGLNLLDVSPYCFEIITGVIILASTTLTSLSIKNRTRLHLVEEASSV